MRKNLIVIISFYVLLSVFVGSAAMPDGAIFMETEDFKNIGNGWIIDSYKWGSYSGMPSGGKMVSGHPSATGKFSDSFKIERAGKYKIHVRYIDLMAETLRKNVGFKLTVTQNGVIVGEKIFDDTVMSIRSTTEGAKKWGNAWGAFVWDNLECELAPGEAILTFGKVHENATTSNARTIDCVIVTDKLSYEPQINDFQKPLYVKVCMDEGQREPVAIHIFGSHSGHYNLNRTGIVSGCYPGLRKEDLMKAGDESPWFNIRDKVPFGVNTAFKFYAIQKYDEPIGEAYFTVCFSKNPSDAGIIKKVSRTGNGSGMVLLIENTPELKYTTDIEESRISLQIANTTKAPPGRRPQKFPVVAGLALRTELNSKEVCDNELNALSILGYSGLRPHSNELVAHAIQNFGFTKIGAVCYLYQCEPKGCFGAPVQNSMNEAAKKWAEDLKKYGLDDKLGGICVMDEPGYEPKHLFKCESCLKRFPEYLKSNKVNLKDIGINDYSEAKPTDEVSNAALYYWTMRFYSDNLTRMNIAQNAALCGALPNSKVYTNYSCEIIDNMIGSGNNWFDQHRNGALSYAATEDWLNLCGTYQFCGFQTAALRMVAQYQDTDWSMLNVTIGRTPWEVQAKAFTEIGGGVRGLRFFNYGPFYMGGDNDSRRPELHQAIREISYAIGDAENAILSSRPARGDVAILFSETSDLWNIGNVNIFGFERTSLYLLLRHCGLRPDLLGEDDLVRLKDYPALFVAEPCIKKERLPLLIEYVKNGGLLYLGAGSLTADQYNRSLGAETAIGFSRSEMNLEKPAERFLQLLLPKAKIIREAKWGETAVPLVFGAQDISGGELLGTYVDGKPAVSMIKLGKGKIIASGFFLGLSYMKGAQNEPKLLCSYSKYPEGPRLLMQKILGIFALKPLIKTDNPLVEAHLLKGEKTDLIVLSNWTGSEQQVKCMAGAAYSKIRPLRSRMLEMKTTPSETVFTTQLGSGDILECTK